MLLEEMNKVFFIGEIIYVSKFKFIYGKNLIHKSVISMKLRLSDGEIAYLRGFDEIADEILRNDFKFVYIQGHLKTEGYTKIDKIYII